MRHLTILVVTIQSILLIAGCGTTTQSIDVEKRTRIYERPIGEVIGAIVAHITVDGYSVENIDRDAGIITTGWQEAGGLMQALGGQQRTRISLLLRETETGTRVTASINWQHRPGYDWQEASVSERQAMGKYNELFEGIERNLFAVN